MNVKIPSDQSEDGSSLVKPLFVFAIDILSRTIKISN